MKQDDDDLDKKSESDADSDDDSSRNQNDDDDLPPAEKLGEPPDNLRRRSDWFQKRSGGK